MGNPGEASKRRRRAGGAGDEPHARRRRERENARRTKRSMTPRQTARGAGREQTKQAETSRMRYGRNVRRAREAMRMPPKTPSSAFFIRRTTPRRHAKQAEAASRKDRQHESREASRHGQRNRPTRPSGREARRGARRDDWARGQRASKNPHDIWNTCAESEIGTAYVPA